VCVSVTHLEESLAEVAGGRLDEGVQRVAVLRVAALYRIQRLPVFAVPEQFDKNIVHSIPSMCLLNEINETGKASVTDMAMLKARIHLFLASRLLA